MNHLLQNYDILEPQVIITVLKAVATKELNLKELVNMSKLEQIEEKISVNYQEYSNIDMISPVSSFIKLSFTPMKLVP